jgi:hypothetical protein
LEASSFKLQPLYSRGKSLRYPLDRRLGGLQSQLKLLTLQGIELQLLVGWKKGFREEEVVEGNIK